MLAQTRIDCYEIKDVLGQGGMGVVFRAYDPNRKGFVALKTMRDAADPAALELFNQEWRTLANLSHPNIVDVLNSGAFEDQGQRKPYFVMPLLPGKTLDKLIKESGHDLTPGRVVEILVQTCRGLQAAHSTGLVHRDVKPSNLFVLSDDSVKIIDFGMVHLSDAAKSVTGIKGTLHYMSPEQLEMKEVTPATDIFSLGVVAYEALTGRNPFSRATERAVFEAIRREFPPPASDLNPAVGKALAQVVAKAMAKNPWNRFASAREFSDYLQRAIKGEAIEGFEVARLQPSLERARKALRESDFEYANEILNELQLEGHLDSEITLLLDQVKEGSRNKAIRQLLDSARTRLQEDEFPLAWQKIQEALQSDPGNEEAQQLQAEIETRRKDQQIEKWQRLVQQHLHNNAFTQARHAIQEIRKLQPDAPNVRELLQSADRRQAEYQKACEEKEQHFESAMRSYGSGEISSALSKLEKIMAIDSRSPGLSLPGRDEVYRETYQKVRSELETIQHAAAEIERAMAGGNLERASELVTEQCSKYPGDLRLQALKFKVEDLVRQEKSSYIAETGRRVESEPDLNRRVQFLEEALARYPNEPHFEELASSLRKRRDLVNSIVAKARQCEEQGLLNEALVQWTTLQNIYPQHPGLDFELERVRSGCDVQRKQEAKLEWVNKIDRLLQEGDYERAHELAVESLETFSSDQELQTLKRLAQEGRDRSADAMALTEQAQAQAAERNYLGAIEMLRRAVSLDPHNAVVRGRLADMLAAQAQVVLSSDWRTSESLVQEALQEVPDHVLAKSLRPPILLAKRAEFVDRCASEARELQAAGDISAALDRIQQALLKYPNDGRLVQLQKTLRDQLHLRRDRDYEELKQAAKRVEQIRDQTSLTALLDRSLVVAKSYPGDPEITALICEIGQKARNAGELEETKVFSAPDTRTEAVAEGAVSSGAAAAVQSTVAESSAASVPVKGAWFSSARSRFSGLTTYQRAAVAAVPVLVLLGVFAFIALWSKRTVVTPKPLATSTVTITTNVDGASVTIDGHASTGQVAALTQGVHQLTAAKLGYKTFARTIIVGAQPSTLKAVLEPEPQTIRISADTPNGNVLLDGNALGPLQGGNFSYDLTGDGSHTLKLMDGRREIFTVEFEVKGGEAARLIRPPLSPGLPVAVVSRLGSRAVIQSSAPGTKVILKSGETQVLAPEGSDLNLTPGETDITLGAANQQVSFSIEAGNAPLLAIRSGIANKGTLAIEANIPDADVFIDGRKSTRRMQNGKWFGQFEPGDHVVAVKQDGFDAVPDQKVSIGAGKRGTVRFALAQSVTTAFLRVENATPEAELSVDGRIVGRVGADGTLGPVEVQPDVDHTIRLQRDDYEPSLEMKRRLTVKSTAVLSGPEMRLKALGVLELTVEPSGAIVMIRQRGQAARRIPGPTLHLKEGRYTLSATADPASYSSIEEDVQVVSGQRVQRRLVVPRKVEVVTIQPVRMDIPDLFSKKDWEKDESGFWYHEGPADIIEPHFQHIFDVERIKKRLGRQEDITWRTYTNGGDHIEFEIDGSNYKRRTFTGGKAGATETKPHGLGHPDFYRLSITVEAQRIIVNLGEVSDTIQLRVDGRTSFTGKFGLRLIK